MKILIVKATSGFIDIEKKNAYNLQEIGLARALNLLGHTCDVVYYGGSQKKTLKIQYNEKGDSFNFFYLRSISVFRNAIFWGITKLTKQYDIVHCGGYDTILSWMLAKRIPEKLVIYNGTYYSDFNVRYNKKCKVIDKIFLPRYKKYNTTFDTKSILSQQFLQKKGLSNVNAIGVGLDLSIIEKKAVSETNFSKKLNDLKNQGYNLLLYIGRIEPRRNIHFLFDLLKKVKETRKNVKLVLIGNGDKEYVSDCFSYATRIGISEDIVHEKFIDQSNLKSVYKVCDIFLLPTKYEIYGMVLLEAMYFGIPTITTMNGGSSMMINHMKNGVIVDNFCTNQWAEKIELILQNSKQKVLLGEQAHATIVNNFTWEALAHKFLTVFQNKIAENDQN